MELNWSTFVLEIANFLVLVWILQRFLYRPVLAVIERRRTAIAKTLSEAEALQTRAAAVREQYERRLADWEQERAAARQTAQQEVDAERARRLQALQVTLEQERESLVPPSSAASAMRPTSSKPPRWPRPASSWPGCSPRWPAPSWRHA